MSIQSVRIVQQYIFKVDLEYPEKLHLLHNDHLLAPDCQIIVKKLQTNME